MPAFGQLRTSRLVSQATCLQYRFRSVSSPFRCRRKCSSCSCECGFRRPVDTQLTTTYAALLRTSPHHRDEIRCPERSRRDNHLVASTLTGTRRQSSFSYDLLFPFWLTLRLCGIRLFRFRRRLWGWLRLSTGSRETWRQSLLRLLLRHRHREVVSNFH